VTFLPQSGFSPRPPARWFTAAPVVLGKRLDAGPDLPGPSRIGSGRQSATIDAMADQTTSPPLEQQLQEIGAQLAWVRDYL